MSVCCQSLSWACNKNKWFDNESPLNLNIHFSEELNISQYLELNFKKIKFFE